MNAFLPCLGIRIIGKSTEVLTTGLYYKPLGRVILRLDSLDHLHGNSSPFCLIFIVFQRQPDHICGAVFATGRISGIHTDPLLVFAVLANRFAGLRHRRAEGVTAQRLDIVAAFKRRGIRHRAATQAAAHLVDRLIFVSLPSSASVPRECWRVDRCRGPEVQTPSSQPVLPP